MTREKRTHSRKSKEEDGMERTGRSNMFKHTIYLKDIIELVANG